MTNGASWKLVAVVLSAYLCALVVLCTPRPIARPLMWVAAPEPVATRSCGLPLTERARALRAAVRGAFAAELGRPRDCHVIVAEQDRLRVAGWALNQSGDGALAALHAALLCDLALVLSAEQADQAERAAVLGRFADQLEADAVVDERGRLLLPRSVVDALYLVRVNVALGLPELEGLSPSARRAYLGALAFHVASVPHARRQWAARAYRALDGAHADHALAQLLLAEGRIDDAVAAYAAIHASTGELRAGNAARGLSQASEAPLQAPTAEPR